MLSGVFKSLKIDAFTVKNLQVTKIAATDSPQKVDKPSPAATTTTTTPVKKESKPEVKKPPAKKDGKASGGGSEGKGKAKAKSSGTASENGSTSYGMTCPFCDQTLQTSKSKQDINRYR